MTRLRYVQGDARPPIQVSLESAGAPIDVSSGSVTVRAYVRVAGASAVKETLTGTKATGRLTEVDAATGAWTVNSDAPYDVAGVGGIVLFYPVATTFDTAGDYEIEYEIDWGAGIKQTVNKLDTVSVRAQVG